MVLALRAQGSTNLHVVTIAATLARNAMVVRVQYHYKSKKQLLDECYDKIEF